MSSSSRPIETEYGLDRRALSGTVLGMSAELAERIDDLEVKLAFQDKLIRELDAYVRTFGDRVEAAERELKELKQAMRSPEQAMGPANEPPPHY
jgi:uncharacterized coiled-coil protein SlyX